MIQTIKTQKQWEDFLETTDFPSFYQSWTWGELQQQIGNDVYRLGIFANDNLIGVCQLIHIHAKRGDYFRCLHGPVLKNWNWKLVRELLDYLKSFGKEKNAEVIRFVFPVERNDTNQLKVKRLGFVKRIGQNQGAEDTLIIDTSKSVDEILASINKKTRYYIRRAEKDGVTTKLYTDGKEGYDDFERLYLETANSKHFVSHKGIKEEYELFAFKGNAFIINAFYHGEVIASGVFINYKGQAVYHHGATSSKFPKIPASYLLIWEAIKFAHKSNAKIFNLWGVVGKDEKSHPWFGFSKFKRGFSKVERHYVVMSDFPISWKYKLLCIYEWIEAKQKGYL